MATKQIANVFGPLTVDPTTGALLVAVAGGPDGAARAPVALAAASVAATPAGVDIQGDTAVLTANANRICASFVNDSDTPIYLAFGHAAVVGAGIRLNANGGRYEINLTNLFTGEIRANHGGGAVNKRLCVQEW